MSVGDEIGSRVPSQGSSSWNSRPCSPKNQTVAFAGRVGDPNKRGITKRAVEKRESVSCCVEGGDESSSPSSSSSCQRKDGLLLTLCRHAQQRRLILRSFILIL